MASAEGAEENIIFTGTLIKAPPMKSQNTLTLRRWHQRYFVLRKNPRVLEYYEDQTMRVPKGKVDLDAVTSLSTNIKHSKYPYIFALETKDRSFFLVAGTAEYRGRWIDKINSALDSRPVRNDATWDAPMVIAASGSDGDLPPAPSGDEPAAGAAATVATVTAASGPPAKDSEAQRGEEEEKAKEKEKEREKALKELEMQREKNTFRVAEKDGAECYLRVEFPCIQKLASGTKEKVVEWNIEFLRGYGQIKDTFKFEAGRRCTTGEGMFEFKLLDGGDIYNAIELAVANYIKKNAPPEEPAAPRLNYVMVETIKDESSSTPPPVAAKKVSLPAIDMSFSPSLSGGSGAPSSTPTTSAYAIIDIQKTEALSRAMNEASPASKEHVSRVTRHDKHFDQVTNHTGIAPSSPMTPFSPHDGDTISLSSYHSDGSATSFASLAHGHRPSESSLQPGSLRYPDIVKDAKAMKDEIDSILDSIEASETPAAPSGQYVNLEIPPKSAASHGTEEHTYTNISYASKRHDPS